MLSAAKVRVHGMQDKNWLLKDKTNQYAGLIKLYEQDRKIHEGDLVKQKRRYSRNIRQMRKDINTKREELAEVVRDKQFLRNAFQEHKRLKLMYVNNQADKVLESIYQVNVNKRKHLDQIRYIKQKKMEKFHLNQTAAFEMQDRIQYELGGKLKSAKQEQAVANFVQRANIKKNAALTVTGMYKKILDILKKDSSYFGVVLEALKSDLLSQGKCLMGATEMGQLTTEYLDDRKFELNTLEAEIKTNMKERERTLKLVRREVAYLTDSFPTLIRKEEAANLDDLYENEDRMSKHSVHWELEEVMTICKRLQRGVLVSRFDQILNRLKEQRQYSEWMLYQLVVNMAKRDALVESRKHALVMLDSLKNLGQESTANYIKEKQQMRSGLKADGDKERDLKQQLDMRGRLITHIKLALQQINQLLSTVAKQPRGSDIVIHDMDLLILQANKKLTQLMQAVSKLELTPEVRSSAGLFYHNIIAHFAHESYQKRVDVEKGLIEFEMEDPNVPSYTIIKLRSKQLVDTRTQTDESK